ncbi:lipoate--protein ligase [Acidihalobacter prosperus]
MRPLRVLDFGLQPALRTQAVYHGVASAMRMNDTPVLSLTSPREPYVCVGAHQNIEQEVDEEYCAAQGLPVVRRHVGGGAVYLDRNQLFFHFIYPEQHGLHLAQELYELFIEPVVRTYRRFGVQAEMRPINDIQVNGRKIGGTGAATFDFAIVMVGSFMFDFDAEHMSRCLRVPSEKFRDKLYDSMNQYITSFRRELGAPSEREEVKQVFLQEVQSSLGAMPVPSQPTVRELKAIDEWEKRLQDPDWNYRRGRRFVPGFVKISANTHVAEASHKAPGGLLRVRMLAREGRIAELEFSGDFTCLPESGVEQLAEALIGAPLEGGELRQRLGEALAELQLDMPGVSQEDLLAVLRAAGGRP